MKTVENPQAVLVSSHYWNAGFNYYDFIHSIKFNPDQTGDMAHGGAQKMDLEVNFRYRIVDDRQIEFEYLDTPQEFWRKLGRDISFTVTDSNPKKIVDFTLEKGEFTIDEPYRGAVTYGHRLSFSESPFPNYGVKDPQDENSYLHPDQKNELLDFYRDKQGPVQASL